MGSQRPPEGTQKGDVYSFAIIIHEIITRQGPFYLQNVDLSPRGEQILQVISNVIAVSTNKGTYLGKGPVDVSQFFSKSDNSLLRVLMQEPCE